MMKEIQVIGKEYQERPEQEKETHKKLKIYLMRKRKSSINKLKGDYSFP